MPPPPAPTPGLVIRFNYLWAREHRQGRDKGEFGDRFSIPYLFR